MRVAPWFAVAMATVTTGCSLEEAQDLPWCEGGGMSLLVAQSVPTAEQLPCFEPLPNGWETSSVQVDQDGTRVRFDSDRAGEDAAVFHFTEVCDHESAVSSPSEFDDVERYDFVDLVTPRFRAQRYYVFPGGCIWWEFDFAPGATAALSIELGDRVAVVPRRELNEIIRETFVDEDV